MGIGSKCGIVRLRLTNNKNYPYGRYAYANNFLDACEALIEVVQRQRKSQATIKYSIFEGQPGDGWSSGKALAYGWVDDKQCLFNYRTNTDKSFSSTTGGNRFNIRIRYTRQHSLFKSDRYPNSRYGNRHKALSKRKPTNRAEIPSYKL